MANRAGEPLLYLWLLASRNVFSSIDKGAYVLYTEGVYLNSHELYCKYEYNIVGYKLHLHIQQFASEIQANHHQSCTML